MVKRAVILFMLILSASNFLVACSSNETENLPNDEVKEANTAVSTSTGLTIQDQASTTAPGDGMAVNVELDSGASVYVHEGSLTAGGTVELRAVSSVDLDSGHTDDVVIGQVYEIVAEGQSAGLTAVITLPIQDSSLTDQEMDQLSIAYWDEGMWHSLPSTVDRESMTISALVTHFSLYTVIQRLLGNTRPDVTVSVSPAVYSGVDDAFNLEEMEDLYIEIRAHDRDGDPLSVNVTLGFETTASWAGDAMLDFRAELGNLLVYEAAAISYLAGNTAVVDITTHIREQAAFTVDRSFPTTRTYELVSETDADIYQLSVSLRSLLLNLDSPLENIYVIVTVIDSLQDDPTTIEKRIAVFQDKLPWPEKLIAPGPHVEVICPSQPLFRWERPRNINYDISERHTSRASFRFRLVEGDDLWGTWSPVADWTCSIWDECDDAEGGDWAIYEWTPSSPLHDGATYSWGMLASAEREPKIGDPRSVPSEIFRFTVDASLEGNECLNARDYSDFGTFLTALQQALHAADFDMLGLLMSDPFYASWHSYDDPWPDGYSPPPTGRDAMVSEMEFSWGIQPGTFAIQNTLEGNRIAGELGISPTQGFGFISSQYLAGDASDAPWIGLLGLGLIDGRYYWTEFIGVQLASEDDTGADDDQGTDQSNQTTSLPADAYITVCAVDTWYYTLRDGVWELDEHNECAGGLNTRPIGSITPITGDPILLELMDRNVYMYPTGVITYTIGDQGVEAQLYSTDVFDVSNPNMSFRVEEWHEAIYELSTGLRLEYSQTQIAYGVADMNDMYTAVTRKYVFRTYIVDTNILFGE